MAALSREGLADLLLAALHLGLDPAANQLAEEITEGEELVEMLVAGARLILLRPATLTVPTPHLRP